MSKENVIVIGGGAAGFFAAIHLAGPQRRVTIIERGKAVLEKVRVSGGGRCNVTHACWTPRELVKFYPRGGRELLGPFNRFACGDTVGWFEDRGVTLKIEDDGRIFPVTDDSATIIDCLWNTAKAKGVEVRTRTRVDRLEPVEPNEKTTAWRVITREETLTADRVVVTTGSNPAVWRWLRELGLSVIDPVPSLFAFNVADGPLRKLMGISLPWVQVNIFGHKLKAEGPLLITHKGVSGPAVLRLSAWGARELAPLQYRFTLVVNWLARRTDDISDELAELPRTEGRKLLSSQSRFDLPQRLWRYLLDKSGIPADRRWAELGKKERIRLAEVLTRQELPVDGKATNKDEFVTAGGVDLREVDFRDFSAKRYSSLHLAGEVLDIDAITGGFNFQAAWTGGFLVGKTQNNFSNPAESGV